MQGLSAWVLMLNWRSVDRTAFVFTLLGTATRTVSPSAATAMSTARVMNGIGTVARLRSTVTAFEATETHGTVPPYPAVDGLFDASIGCAAAIWCSMIGPPAEGTVRHASVGAPPTSSGASRVRSAPVVLSIVVNEASWKLLTRRWSLCTHTSRRCL